MSGAAAGEAANRPGLCLRQRVLWTRRPLQGGADVGERGVGLLADGLDRRQADHDDQRQHHGILNGGGAIFSNKKLLDTVENVLHLCHFLLVFSRNSLSCTGPG